MVKNKICDTDSSDKMPELKIIRMSDIQSEPVDWLWEPYIPYGAISLIQGDGEMGKTTLSLAIAAFVTRGESLPEVLDMAEGYRDGGGNSASAFPANVIIQNGEDSYNRTIKPRLEKLGADCDRVFSIDDEDVALTFTDTRIEQTIIETDAKLLVIDPVQAFWGRANMNAANSVRPVLKQLGAVAERTGCAIILVGHLNKKGGRATYRGLGSIDIFSAARSVITVGKTDSSDNIRMAVHNKSNLAPAGPTQTFGLDPVSGFYWAGESDANVDDVLNGKRRQSKPENKSTEAQSFIKSVLRNGLVPSANILDMADERGIAEKTLQRAKSDLGVYSRKIDGVWCWELPIEAEYTEVYEDGHGSHYSQHSQNTQDGHCTALTILATLPDIESVAV